MAHNIKHTVCARDCYDSCPLDFEIDDSGKVLRNVRAVGHSYVSAGGCARSNADVKRLYTNRIQTPLLKTDSGFSEISWNEALEILAKNVRQISESESAEKILFMNYAGNQGLISLVYPERLWRKIGATLSDGAICTKTGHVAIKAHHGNSHGLDAYDLEKYKVLIYWGMNPVVTAPHQWKHAADWRNKTQGKIVVIDVAKTETAKRADIFLQVRPQSDVALAFGIMKYLIENQYINKDFIKKYTSGFDKLDSEISKISNEKIESLTGVKLFEINYLANLYAENRPSATFIGVGIQKHTNGFDQVRAVSFIPAILGQHRGYFYSNGQSTLIDEAYLSGSKFYGYAKETSQIHLPTDLKNGKFRMLYVSTMNPAATLPNSDAFISGMNRPDVFAVVHDTHFTETSTHADLVLPALTYLEKADMVLPWGHHRVRLSHAVCAPVTQGKSEAEVMQLLAKKLNFTDEFLYEHPLKALQKTLEPALPAPDFDIQTQHFFDLKKKHPTEYPTPSGKLEFYSKTAEKDGFSPLPKLFEPNFQPKKFQLISGASPKYTNSQFEESNGKRGNYLYINEIDAIKLGISAGDLVLLKNDIGELVLKAVISDKTAEGVLFTYRLANGFNGKNINVLISDSPQHVGGGPLFNSCFVEISKT